MNILVKKKIKRITAVFVMVFLPMISLAQNGQNGQGPSSSVKIELANEPAIVLGGRTITIGDAIKMAINNNYNVLSGAYDAAMTDTLYKQLQKKYSLYLNADAGYTYSKNTPSSAILYGKDARTTDVNVSLSKAFATGTQVTTGMNNQYTKITPDPMGFNSSPPEYYMPIFFAGVQQELLKNSFGKNDRLQDKIALNTAAMQKDMILQSLSMVVVGVIVDYWNVVIAKTSMDNNSSMLEQTKRVRTIVQRNVNLGLVDSFQINYYNSLVANSEANVARAKKNYASALRTFLSAINSTDTEIAAEKILLSDKLINLNEEEALKIAFTKRADYQNALLAIDNAKMNLDMVNNSGMPSLTASLQVQSLAQEDSLGTAYNKVSGFNYPTISGKLAFTHAFDDSDQKVKERNANFQLKQAEIALNQARRYIADDIKNQIDNINTSYIEYKSAREARIQSEAYFNKMVDNLLRGRLDSATVKNGLDALTMSRQAEVNALVGYNVSLLQFLVAKNQLWEEYNIDVREVLR
jgi:outer membrane protein TolC